MGKLISAAEAREWALKNPQIVLDEILRTDFSRFIEMCFRTLNPGTGFLMNWHIEAIAWHLEQVRLGKIKRLVVTMPPRSAKSISGSVAFPAFVHGHDPTNRIITVSYAQTLSSTLHNDYRRIITSPWYKRVFTQTRVDPKKDTEFELSLTRRGGRIATSVGGSVTGRGGDIIIVDDPLKADDAKSEPLRTKVNEWYSNTLLSRLDQKREGAIIIVTQRLHGR
jgi:hypothetical protein